VWPRADTVHRQPGYELKKICKACKRAGRLKFHFNPTGNHNCPYNATADDIEVKVINFAEILVRHADLKDTKKYRKWKVHNYIQY
jgi:hypothetical protein